MFGLLRVPTCSLRPAARADWTAHVCGLCLTLRDRVGQVARLATNFDAALVSALYEAQVAVGPRRSQLCPLRGFRRAEVVGSSSPGARLAAATATAMASVKLDDAVDDGGPWLGRSGRLLRPLAASAGAVAQREAGGLALDLGPVFAQARRQVGLEAVAGLPLTGYSRPTEEAIGEVFAQTARLARRPWNEEPLLRLGRMFGRLVYLMDAVRDLEGDRRAGRFNPLAERPEDSLRRATLISHRSRAVIAGLLPRLDLPRPELVTALLTDGLRAACRRTLLAAGGAGALATETTGGNRIVPGFGDVDPETAHGRRRWFSCLDVCCVWDCGECCGGCCVECCGGCCEQCGGCCCEGCGCDC